jgi:hypothetical protein
MNFYEQQLRALTGKTTAFKSTSPAYISRACFLTLGGDRRARLDFIELGTSQHFEALQVTILNRNEGKVDTLLLRFKDYFAPKRVGSCDPRTPHIWVDQGEPRWWGEPTPAEFKTIAQAAFDYIALFA